MRWAVLVAILGSSTVASAQRWVDATPQCLGATAEWTNKVEVADVDGDGHIDILLANGGNYSTKGTDEPARVWRNLGTWSPTGPNCAEISDGGGCCRCSTAHDARGCLVLALLVSARILRRGRRSRSCAQHRS